MKERHTRVSEIKPVWSGKTSLERNKLQRTKTDFCHQDGQQDIN